MAVDKVLGYEYLYSPNHPLANKSGKVYIHRIIASEKIGRLLLSEEHVHHIDGNKLNNTPENLLILSSSEHTRIEKSKIGNEEIFCDNCRNKLSMVKRDSITGLCSNCYPESTRRFNPTKDELEKDVWSFPITKLSEKYGVSDRAISKRCSILEIKTPPIGYWSKKK